jgi:WD40 repeat protein
VLTGSEYGTARLWNADSGAPIGEPIRHDSRVYAVAFSPAGKTVLTGSSDGTARLWNADSGAPIGEPMRHDDSVTAVAFSPDGRVLSQTQNWLHISNVTPEGLKLIESRLSRAVAFHFPESCDPCDELTVAVKPTGGSVRIETIRLDFQDEEPLPGDPADLLADWQERLALVFDANGKIVPRWPITAPRDPAPSSSRRDGSR